MVVEENKKYLADELDSDWSEQEIALATKDSLRCMDQKRAISESDSDWSDDDIACATADSLRSNDVRSKPIEDARQKFKKVLPEGMNHYPTTQDGWCLLYAIVITIGLCQTDLTGAFQILIKYG